MANSFHANTHPRLVNLVNTLAAIFGVTFDFGKDPAFRIILESPDGSGLNVIPQGQPSGQQNYPSQVSPNAFAIPTQGPANASVSSGTTTLVASTKTVTVDAPADGVTPVPAGSTVYATVTTPAGVTRVLSAVRASDTTITISSPGSAYKAVTLADNGATGVLVAGTVDVTLDNAVGDLLSVRESVAGGTAAAGFSVKRKNATEVTVFAHKADGSVETLNTSTVQVFNHGTAATETSLVRWAVVRP